MLYNFFYSIEISKIQKFLVMRGNTNPEYTDTKNKEK